VFKILYAFGEKTRYKIMGDEEKGYTKEFSNVTKNFIKRFGLNVAICSYGSKGNVKYVVFQFSTSYGDVHAVQCSPMKKVEDIEEILFTCGLAVDNAAKLIKVKEAKDA